MDNSHQIIGYIVFSIAVIFFLDILTPLGLIVGILYFIPLFFTVYLKWKDAPSLITIISILLIFAGFFLSPRDFPGITILFAFINRLFLSFMMIIGAFFISSYTQIQEDLRMNEERYRSLSEWSPDAIVVLREGKILYTNAAGLNLFGAEEREKIIGQNILDLVDPADRENVKKRIDQTMLGARMILERMGISRMNGTVVQVRASTGKITWDGGPAIQIHLMENPNR